MEDQSTPMTTQDLYNASVIFSQAISLMLEENQGIIVDIVPEMNVVSKEPVSIIKLYGPDCLVPGTYAANCLLARKLSESGVRRACGCSR